MCIVLPPSNCLTMPLIFPLTNLGNSPQIFQHPLLQPAILESGQETNWKRLGNSYFCTKSTYLQLWFIYKVVPSVLYDFTGETSLSALGVSTILEADYCLLFVGLKEL